MSNILDEVRSRFLAEAQIKLIEVSAASQIELCGVSERCRENPLFNYAHRVSGVARTLGFEGLGESARELEAQLEEFFDNSLPNAFPEDALDDFLEELACAVCSTRSLQDFVDARA